MKPRLLVVIWLAFVPWAAACKRADAGTAPTSASAPAVHVDAAPAVLRDVPTFLPLTGQVISARETDLAANVAGRVVSTRVERGDHVKAGDVLATIDVRAASLQADEARANAATAASQADAADLECARAQRLASAGAIAGAELERLDAQCRTSRLAVGAAEARSSLATQTVGDGTVRALFDAFVADRYVHVGEYVRADSRVATLVDLASLRLEVAIPETSIAVASPGTPLTFRVPGYPSRAFQGTVRYVSAVVRPGSRDVVVEATIDDPADLRPGMFAEVRLRTGTAQLPAVPARAMTLRGGRPTVFVLAGDRVDERLVQVEDDHGDPIALARGVLAGDRVVLDPREDLKNGAQVR